MICSQCQKNYPERQCYLNSNTKRVWCMNCMAKVKKERNYYDKVKGDLLKSRKRKN